MAVKKRKISIDDFNRNLDFFPGLTNEPPSGQDVMTSKRQGVKASTSQEVKTSRRRDVKVSSGQDVKALSSQDVKRITFRMPTSLHTRWKNYQYQYFRENGDELSLQGFLIEIIDDKLREKEF